MTEFLRERVTKVYLYTPQLQSDVVVYVSVKISNLVIIISYLLGIWYFFMKNLENFLIYIVFIKVHLYKNSSTSIRRVILFVIILWRWLMNYGYVRVSTKDQNIHRQMDDMYNQGLTDDCIFIDKQSGKDFDRTNYKKMKALLKDGDLLIIKSIDRLGRNYDMIIEEWKDIVNRLDVDIVVLDMPLLDTRTEGKNLVGKFISDIVLQILSFVAENERENIRKRQAEGIRIAKLQGKHLGRPKYVLPVNYNEIIMLYNKKRISLSDALKKLNMNKSTFYKYLKFKKQK